ncbi:MAG: hypothetical protein QXR39_01420 [Candidatus Methanomethylicia archaeon]
MSNLFLFIYECRFKIILALSLLGITFLIIPNIRIVLLEFDHIVYFIETFYIGLFFLINVLIIFLIPILIPPKRDFKPETIRLFCPNCGSKLIFSESSLKCVNCDYSLINEGEVKIPLMDLVSMIDLALTGCSSVCLYAQSIGECAIVRRYANKFNAALPENCPYRTIEKEKKK